MSVYESKITFNSTLPFPAYLFSPKQSVYPLHHKNREHVLRLTIYRWFIQDNRGFVVAAFSLLPFLHPSLSSILHPLSIQSRIASSSSFAMPKIRPWLLVLD